MESNWWAASLLFTSYVLVPGADGDPVYWHRVVPLLEETGEPVVAVRLPVDDESAGLTQYADTVVSAGGGLDEVILVAQPIGAYAASMARDRCDVQRIVLVTR